jgi:hypothetical protein
MGLIFIALLLDVVLSITIGSVCEGSILSLPCIGGTVSIMEADLSVPGDPNCQIDPERVASVLKGRCNGVPKCWFRVSVGMFSAVNLCLDRIKCLNVNYVCLGSNKEAVAQLTTYNNTILPPSAKPTFQPTGHTAKSTSQPTGPYIVPTGLDISMKLPGYNKGSSGATTEDRSRESHSCINTSFTFNMNASSIPTYTLLPVFLVSPGYISLNFHMRASDYLDIQIFKVWDHFPVLAYCTAGCSPAQRKASHRIPTVFNFDNMRVNYSGYKGIGRAGGNEIVSLRGYAPYAIQIFAFAYREGSIETARVYGSICKF